MDYTNFLPEYPNIDDPKFQQKILNKKEFNELRLAKSLEKVGKGEFLKSQKIISRFVNQHTMYDELLLYHETGTGKSGVAFGITEELHKSTIFKRAYIFAGGQDLLNSLMKQLVFAFSIRYDVKQTSELREIKKKISDFYSFRTSETFAKELEKVPDEFIINQYSNSIFIIDEVHNLKSNIITLQNNEVNEERIYKQFHRLFHLTKNRKILLMTGTPIRNEVSEIANIMNLILPLDEQLPTGNIFMEKYVSNDNIVDERKLKEYFKGRISFLLSSKVNINRIYMGDFISKMNIEQFKLFHTKMKDIQATSYKEAYSKDTIGQSSFYLNSRQASLFVFPDGTWGQEGFDSYSKKGIINDDFKKKVSKLNILENMSSKYSFIINDILENERKNIYIYNPIVNGSGINLFTQILETYGFQRLRGNPRQKAKRYIALTSETSQSDSLLRYYNSNDNRYGEYCQVIIGSIKISEGFTFKNIQIIHICSPHWNYTETQQAIARGIRFRSHEALIRDGVIPTVIIYQHAAIISEKNISNSVDVVMMEISQSKDFLIRKMDRVIKESAFDCPLTFERNKRYGKFGSRDCDYQSCDYKCDTSSLNVLGEDISTYRMYYESDENIIQSIIKILNDNLIISFEALQEITQVDPLHLLKVLDDIIQYNIPFVNKYNIECFLREDKNIYYLVDNIVLSSSHVELSHYTRQPYFIQKTSLKNLVEQKRPSLLSEKIQSLYSSKTKIETTNIIRSFPLRIQELFIERSIYLTVVKKNKNIMSDWIMEIYSDHIQYNKNGYIATSNLLVPDTIRCLDEKTEEWIDCVPVEQENKDLLIRLEENNPYGYYGIVQDDNFCIKDVKKKVKTRDKRTVRTGGNCLEVTWNKNKLAELFMELKIQPDETKFVPNVREILLQKKTTAKLLDDWADYDNRKLTEAYYWFSKTKRELCGILKDFFKEKDLLIKGACGKVGKLKDK